LRVRRYPDRPIVYEYEYRFAEYVYGPTAEP